MKRNIGRIITIFAIFLVPALVLLNVFMGYLYWSTEKEIARLEKEQTERFEENKLMIANIAIANSPARIEPIARDQLGLEKITPDRTIFVDVKSSQKRKAEQSSGDSSSVEQSGGVSPTE